MKVKHSLIVIVLFIVVLCGCNAGNSKPIEYTIDDFLEVWTIIGEEMDAETEYWTDDESNDPNKYSDLFYKVAKKNKLKLNTKIIIRGIKGYEGIDGFYLESSDEKKYEGYSWNSIYCDMTNYEDNSFILISQGDPVVIEGTLSKKTKGGNGIYYSSGITDCTIVSPEIDDISFNNNIYDLYYSYDKSTIENCIVHGVVKEIIPISYSDEEKEALLQDSMDASTDEYFYYLALRYATHILKLSTDDQVLSLDCLINVDLFDMSLQIGDNIIINNDVQMYNNVLYIGDYNSNYINLK